MAVADPASTDSTLAFVFPGQGSQSVGMLGELAAIYPVVQQTFAEASEGAGVDLWALTAPEREAELNQTEFTQPALLAAGIAVWRVWQSLGGAMPARLAGHSLGEYTALVAAGVLSLADGARLVARRGQLMQHAVPAGKGAMAAVLGAEDALVAEVCAAVANGDVLVPANFNSPGQIVIGGDTEAVDRALTEFAARGIRKAIRLPVSVPSHTPLMSQAAEQLGEVMASLNWSQPALPVIQNVDAGVQTTVEGICEALQRQLYLPVRWTDCVTALTAAGSQRIAECGPGKVLTGLCKRIDKTIDARSLAAPADLQAALEQWSTS